MRLGDIFLLEKKFSVRLEREFVRKNVFQPYPSTLHLIYEILCKRQISIDEISAVSSSKLTKSVFIIYIFTCMCEIKYYIILT